MWPFKTSFHLLQPGEDPYQDKPQIKSKFWVIFIMLALLVTCGSSFIFRKAPAAPLPTPSPSAVITSSPIPSQTPLIFTGTPTATGTITQTPGTATPTSTPLIQTQVVTRIVEKPVAVEKIKYVDKFIVISATPGPTQTPWHELINIPQTQVVTQLVTQIVLQTVIVEVTPTMTPSPTPSETPTPQPSQTETAIPIP